MKGEGRRAKGGGRGARGEVLPSPFALLMLRLSAFFSYDVVRD
jgi:hypothetical protein